MRRSGRQGWKVTIEQLGSIGELVGAVATVATLAYLAVQIRANTRMMRSQSLHRGHELSAQLALTLGQDRELSGLFNRGVSDYDALEPDEKTQFTFLLSQFISNLENSYNDVSAGLKERASFERDWEGTRIVLATAGGRAVWKRHRHGYPADLRSLLDERLLSETGGDTTGGHDS